MLPEILSRNILLVSDEVNTHNFEHVRELSGTAGCQQTYTAFDGPYGVLLLKVRILGD